MSSVQCARAPRLWRPADCDLCCRTTAGTHMHEHSSRSHAIVTLNFTQVSHGVHRGLVTVLVSDQSEATAPCEQFLTKAEVNKQFKYAIQPAVIKKQFNK